MCDNTRPNTVTMKADIERARVVAERLVYDDIANPADDIRNLALCYTFAMQDYDAAWDTLRRAGIDWPYADGDGRSMQWLAEAAERKLNKLQLQYETANERADRWEEACRAADTQVVGAVLELNMANDKVDRLVCRCRANDETYDAAEAELRVARAIIARLAETLRKIDVVWTDKVSEDGLLTPDLETALGEACDTLEEIFAATPNESEDADIDGDALAEAQANAVAEHLAKMAANCRLPDASPQTQSDEHDDPPEGYTIKWCYGPTPHPWAAKAQQGVCIGAYATKAGAIARCWDHYNLERANDLKQQAERQCKRAMQHRDQARFERDTALREAATAKREKSEIDSSLREALVLLDGAAPAVDGYCVTGMSNTFVEWSRWDDWAKSDEGREWAESWCRRYTNLADTGSPKNTGSASENAKNEDTGATRGIIADTREVPMKVIYIAGPFRGKTPWDVELNIRRAEEASLEVANLGAMPLCPHTCTRFFDGQLNAQFWLDGTMEMMRRCDALLAIDRWTESAGAQGEVKEAQRLGIPVFTNLRSLRVWLSEASKD